jgi:Sigma-70 region 2
MISSETDMTTGRIHNLIHYLRRTARPGEASGASDSELLQRYAAGRDEAAFELLVWRHAGMVLAVCRRVLGDAHEAEDALQATFLILASAGGSFDEAAAARLDPNVTYLGELKLWNLATGKEIAPL